MKRIATFHILAAFLALGTLDASAQPRNVSEETSFERGRRSFIENDCYSCHGWYQVPHERWGDLAKSAIVAADNAGEVLGPFLRRGIQCRVGLKTPMMPSFWDLSDEEMKDLIAYVHFERQDRRYKELVAAKSVARGDPAAGKTAFNGKGKCADCHNGATSLTAAVRKYPLAVLREQFLRPENATGQGLDAHRKLLERTTQVETNNILAYLASLK